MKVFYALLATVGLMFGASAASAIDLQYCEADGLVYCDGIGINFVGLQVFGTQIGCHTDPLGGSIVYSLFSPGLGATYGHTGPSYTNLSGEVSFTPPFVWRLVDHVGTAINDGIMCVGIRSTEGGDAAGG